MQHLSSLRDIERERRRLLRDPEVRRIYELAQDVDIVLVTDEDCAALTTPRRRRSV